MENFETLDQNISPQQDRFTLTESMVHHAAVSAKWSKFLAIVGFVFIGFIVIAALSVGLIADKLPNVPFSGLITVLYLLIAALYFYPTYTLFVYATKVRKALNTGDQEDLEEGYKNLASHHKFLGILILIFLCLYGLIFLAGIGGAMFLS